ncbi:MAG: RagB/SusD family nutrient uptake outer membrane protein [Flavisolibacter sp.]|nr:RagB/SusD family nutrient uptake outer membrane protein [Flavisolibacter sp.]
MKHIKYSLLLLLFTILGTTACKKQLDVKNPNEPSITDLYTEPGIIALSKGAVYNNGLNLTFNAGLNQLGSGFTYTMYAYQELLADVLSASASNQNINVINLPEYVILDNGTKVSSGLTQRGTIRSTNTRSNRSSNSIYYEWAYMYALNNSCNNLLDVLPKVTFSGGDAASKRKTIEAWAYWWKGYAYSRIGSIYYAGIINDSSYNNSPVGQTNANYVTHDALITEANKNLDKAAAALNGITSSNDYDELITQIIPEFIQTGNGGVPTITMFLHSINTMKARNLLVNKRVSAMTTTDWDTIIKLTANGITRTDNVFTVRTTSTNGILSTTGNVVAMSTGASSTFRISERFIQEFKDDDKRLTNNFSKTPSPRLDQTGGITFSTRWRLLAGSGASSANTSPNLPGVILYSDLTAGKQEIYVGPSYEENALMRAEALIYTGKIDEGLALVDAVRNYQGAGLGATPNKDLPRAIDELRRERRVALVFRGISFYDYRRWGIIDDVSKGGGRKEAVVLTAQNGLNTNATINYNFLDYWDVPADEFELNPPATGSAPVQNPG